MIRVRACSVPVRPLRNVDAGVFGDAEGDGGPVEVSAVPLQFRCLGASGGGQSCYMVIGDMARPVRVEVAGGCIT